MKLRDVLPELAQKMTEDLRLARKDPTIEIRYVLLEYAVIWQYVNDIYFLPGNSLEALEARIRAALAIEEFLQGQKTLTELRHLLMAILLEYRNRKKTEKEG